MLEERNRKISLDVMRGLLFYSSFSSFDISVIA